MTVEHKPVMLPEVFGDRPYAIVLVDLDEGVRMMANVVGLAAHSMEPDDVAVGDPVEATWEPLSDGRHPLLLRPRSA